MGSRVITLVLLLGVAFSLVGLATEIPALRLPGDHRGYEPVQPIAFSHRLHAGELQIGCLYCHAGAEKSRHAGIPPANPCMNCHRFVTAPLGAIRAEEETATREGRKPRPVISPELRKLYEALALGETMQPDPGKTPTLVAWVKVHSLPDFAYFDHRAHLTAGVRCQQCHGPVETMERVRQMEPLTMGWCVNCHRETTRTGVADKKVEASIDCVTCHF